MSYMVGRLPNVDKHTFDLLDTEGNYLRWGASVYRFHKVDN